MPENISLSVREQQAYDMLRGLGHLRPPGMQHARASTHIEAFVQAVESFKRTYWGMNYHVGMDEDFYEMLTTVAMAERVGPFESVYED